MRCVVKTLGGGEASDRKGLELDACRSCQFFWFDPGEFETMPEALPSVDAPPSIETRDLPQAAKLAFVQAKMDSIAKQAEHMTAVPDGFFELFVAMLHLPVELAQEDDPGLKKVAKVTWGLALAVTVVSFLAWGSVIDVERLALDTSDPWKLGGLTLLTPFFVHGSLLHLFGNLYFFVSFGDNVEDLLGGLRYVGLLLLAVVVSSSTFLLLHWGESIQVVGASGGVSALIVAYVLFFPRAKLATLFFWNWLIRLPSWFYLFAWIGLQLLGMQREITGPGLEDGGVAYSAHVAGALVGLLGWGLWRNRMR